ncbi:MAG: GntR family transcriptional regulator [Actinomycetes bacterium]
MSKLAIAKIQPAYAQIASQLREMVISGRLGPGDQLPSENDLAAEFGVSRGTVREAIRSLAAENLVHTTRGVTGGTFIAFVNPEAVSASLRTSLGLLSQSSGVTVEELLEARESFEAAAARYAAARRTDEQLKTLESLLPSPDDSITARFEKNQAFHKLLLDASGNRVLELIARPIYDLLSTHLAHENIPMSDMQAAECHHKAIYDSVAARDVETAGRAMSEHIARLIVIYESKAGK